MTKIFVDTNIFLHFKFFIEINWLESCHDDKCKIIIAPIVIDELDKHKIGKDDKNKRAKRVLQQIEYYSENQLFEIQKNIEIEILNSKPKKSTFTKYHLDPNEHDNQLIASIIEYQSYNTEDKIFLCSNDIGPRLRSKQYGINNLKLPETYLLPEKDNAIDKQIKSLIEENTFLKSRIPKPLLQVENEKDYIKIKINEYTVEKESFIRDKMTEIKKEYPYLSFDEKRNSYNPLATLASLSLISKEQVDRYNSELDEFYSKFGLYLHSFYDYEVTNNLSVRINIFLTNIGNVPCDDVDIYCHFPDGFDLLEEDDLDDPPEKPNPPSTPKTFYENMNSGFNFPRPYFPNIGSQPMPKINRPSIRKTKSYEVHFNRKYVKHCTRYPLDTLFAVYKSFTEMKNFAIDYTIVAGNIPEPVEGKLNIIFEK
jgi:rRNA-processing protein FCF1